MKFAAACIALSAVASAAKKGYASPSYKDSAYGSYGGYGYNAPYGGYSEGNTYGHVDGIGYGIYNFKPHPKPLFGNDGYKLVQRSDPHSKNSKDTYAKCVMKDPKQEGYVNGNLWLAQSGYGTNT